MTKKTPHKYSMLVYLLIANGITWLGWIPGLVIGAQQGYLMPKIDTFATLFETGLANSQHLVLAVAFSLGVYGPLVGGFIATWMDGGKEGVRELWGRMTNWRVGKRWYLAVVGIAIFLSAVPVAIFALTGGLAVTAVGGVTVSYLVFAFFQQMLSSGIGEEPGWRGFLLPRLQARFEGDKYIWILGLIWAIWHYPLTIMVTVAGMPEVTGMQKVIMIFLALAGQTMTLIGMSFIYVWLYNHTRSVFVSILFHALGNLFNFWFVSYLAEPGAVTVFTALMPWAVVVILEKRLGKEHFPGQTTTVSA